MHKIAKDLFIESKFPGVTVGAIVGPEGVIGIDAPTHPADARQWRQQLLETTGKPLRFVISLDHQRDRQLGLQWLEAPVIAHELTYERLRLLPEQYRNLPAEPGADSEQVADLAGLHVVLPQITFAERLTLLAGDREVVLTHRPGSAPGAIWVEVPAQGVVFTGDAVAVRTPPWLQEADLDQWLAALSDLRRRRPPVRHIVPGRGGLTDKDGVKATEDFLKLASRRVAAYARARKPRAELEALAQDLLGKPAGAAELRALYLRRLRGGLEHLYDQQAILPLK